MRLVWCSLCAIVTVSVLVSVVHHHWRLGMHAMHLMNPILYPHSSVPLQSYGSFLGAGMHPSLASEFAMALIPTALCVIQRSRWLTQVEPLCITALHANLHNLLSLSLIHI